MKIDIFIKSLQNILILIHTPSTTVAEAGLFEDEGADVKNRVGNLP